MPLPTTSQDFVKGIDFTGAATGTAAEHNQLVEQATPYTDGISAQEGIGFILTTTDTALNTPSVPNPLQSSDYNKWKRYVWNRRPHGAPSPTIPKAYMWIDAATSNATYLKWVLIDSASYTSVGGGLGTPLQTAIDAINTDSANALAAATQASTDVGLIKTKIGYNSIGSTSLQAQVTTVTNAEIVDAANIALINNAIGGSGGLVGTGGINGQLASIQAQLTAGLAASQNVSNLLPPSSGLSGSMLRWNSDLTTPAVEYYNPADTAQEVIQCYANGTITFPVNALTATGALAGVTSLPTGVWLMEAVLSGIHNGQSSTARYSTLVIKLGTTVVGHSIPSGTSSNAGSGWPITLIARGIVTVTKASGAQTITASVQTAAANSTIDCIGDYCVIIFRRISLPQV